MPRVGGGERPQTWDARHRNFQGCAIRHRIVGLANSSKLKIRDYESGGRVMDRGYLLIADILGFSKIINNSGESAKNDAVETWLNLVDEAEKKAKLHRKPQLISDTVIASSSDDEIGLRKIVQFSRYLLENGVKRSLLIRGAISYGAYEWGRLTYGRTVINAHNLESNQDWIGISCDGDLPRADTLWGPDGLVCYPPPLKQGRIGLQPVVVWAVPEPSELQTASSAFPLAKPEEFMEWPWLRRLRNTVHFGRHLKSLSESNRESWAQFNGSII